MKQRLVISSIAALGVWFFAGVGLAATITVTTTSGGVNQGDGSCSLREAVQAANTDTNFGGCTRVGTGSTDTIVLGSQTYASNAALVITSRLTLRGAGPTSTTISVPGGQTALSVKVAASRTVIMQDLRVTTGGQANCVVVETGTASLSNVDLDACHSGVQVLTDATAYFTDSTLRNSVFGGYVYGNIELFASEITGNSSTGLSVAWGGSALLDDVEVANNQRSGIQVNHGQLRVDSSYVHSNHDGNIGGAGIRAMNQSVVEVLNSTVTFNESIKGGGGISSEYSDVTINDSLIDANECTGATCNGGGIRVIGTGLDGQGVALTDSTIINNIAEGNGGGVALMVQTGTSFSSVRSTLAFNNASLHGGGLYSLSQHNVVASTISSNVAGQTGGGIYHQGGGELHVYESTIARNHAARTGGLYVHSASNPLMFGNIIALNTSNFGNRDLRVPSVGITWGANILLSDSSGIGSLISGPIYDDPLLTDLSFVDGNLVHQLMSGSPAIMSSSNSNAATTSNAPNDWDQLGRARPNGTRVDLGAVEYY